MALSRLGRLGRVQQRRAYEVLGRLRGCGFSGGEISLLVGGRWSDSAVRKYALWDGVVDSSGKDRLMGLLADITEDFNDGDLEAFRVAREALGARWLVPKFILS